MPVAVFCPVFVSQKINIKRSPNTVKLFGDFFLGKKNTGSFERGPEEEEVGHEAPGRALVPRGPIPAPFDLIPAL